jgi:hypothetical protein
MFSKAARVAFHPNNKIFCGTLVFQILVVCSRSGELPVVRNLSGRRLGALDEAETAGTRTIVHHVPSDLVLRGSRCEYYLELM